MDDLETAAGRLMKGPEGARLRKLAESQEGQRLNSSAEAAAVAEAARRGDAAALRAAMSRLLATPEGRKLARRLTGHD